MICTAWYQWLLTNWEQTKISFPFTKLMSDWSYIKKKNHHSASILCSDLCHLMNVMLFLEVFFFSFNINPIQWQWNPDIHFIHKSDQSQPLLCPCQNNFPSKEFDSYYASCTFSSVSFTISSYLLHATLTPHGIHINRTDKAPFSSNSLGFCVKH